MKKNFSKALIFLVINLMIFGSSFPVFEIPVNEFKELFDELDKKDLNNFEDLSWVDKDENDTELLQLQSGQPFVFSDQYHLYLYTKKSPDTPYLLTLENIKDAPMDINGPTKILIPGWLSEWNNTYFSMDTKNSILKASNSNVIITDLKKYAFLDYPYACIKARKIGAAIGRVLIALYKHKKIHLEDIHIIGISLGAHISGFVGKTVKAQSGKKVGRITGLDPAGPVFEMPVLLSDNKRLHKDDAIFTDIIHTGGGKLGFRKALGHADFFPNGGLPIQPACGNESSPFRCSHLMGAIYFNQSIIDEKFVATSCSSWENFKQGKCNGSEFALMGYHLDARARGTFFLHTNTKHIDL